MPRCSFTVIYESWPSGDSVVVGVSVHVMLVRGVRLGEGRGNDTTARFIVRLFDRPA